MIAWYVCVLVVSIVALGFYVLGAALASKKSKCKLDSKRDDILRYLDTLRYIIKDKITTDKKLAEQHNNEKDISLSYVEQGLARQWEITKADLDALIQQISIK